MQMPTNAPGVPSPYVATVHPYPTRYHGGVWTRPVFGFPRVANVSNVIMPRQLSGSPDGLGCSTCSGLGDQVDTGDGLFRRPRADGGGIFNRALAGDGIGTEAVVGFLLAGVLAGGLTYWYLTKRK
jgi:hypothetical protein